MSYPYYTFWYVMSHHKAIRTGQEFINTRASNGYFHPTRISSLRANITQYRSFNDFIYSFIQYLKFIHNIIIVISARFNILCAALQPSHSPCKDREFFRMNRSSTNHEMNLKHFTIDQWLVLVCIRNLCAKYYKSNLYFKNIKMFRTDCIFTSL